MSGPVCILAGAGTGKTRTITHRIAYGVHTGVYVPEQVLAVTFTARAAGELRGRLAALGRRWRAGAHLPRRGDAPAAVLRAPGARRPDARAGREQAPAGGDGGRAGPAVRPTAPACATSPARSSGPRRPSPRPEDYRPRAKAAGREPPFEAAAVAAVYASYESAKQRDGALDFEDLLLVTAYALEEHPDVAAQVRGQYRHFVVDEYQDVNPLQQRLLDAWLGGRDDVCVVGDPNQTIYSFTGATPTTCWASPTAIPTPAWSSSSATTGPPRRSWRWPTG